LWSISGIRHRFVTLVTDSLLYEVADFGSMAIPLRRADPKNIAQTIRTFFITSSIAGKRNLLQSDRSARLFIDVLNHYRAQSKFLLHAFVVMPDHVHVLISVYPNISSIERPVQFIKGGFAFRAGRELGFRPPMWQRGFSEVRIYDSEHWTRIIDYIAQNPVRRRLVENPAEFPHSSLHSGFDLDIHLRGKKPQSDIAYVRHV
jgi:putative transposase